MMKRMAEGRDDRDGVPPQDCQAAMVSVASTPGSRQTQARSLQEAPTTRVYEPRYRTHQYFLEDQLRYSEAVQDFRSVKNLLSQTPQFNLTRVFNQALRLAPVAETL